MKWAHREAVLIDGQGSQLSLMHLSEIMAAIDSGKVIILQEFQGGTDMLQLGMMLMANYERIRDGKG